jgi:hypothetical protein
MYHFTAHIYRTHFFLNPPTPLPHRRHRPHCSLVESSDACGMRGASLVSPDTVQFSQQSILRTHLLHMVHVPKAGGTTVEWTFDSRLPREHASYLRPVASPCHAASGWLFTQTEFYEPWIHRSYDTIMKLDRCEGEIYSKQACHPNYPRMSPHFRVVLVGLLRDPVDRFASAFAHSLGVANRNLPCMFLYCRGHPVMAERFRKLNVTMDEVAASYHTTTFSAAHNYQVAFIGGGELERALKRLAAFDAVVIPTASLLPPALRRIASLLGVQNLSSFCDVRHVHRTRLSSANMTQASRSAVRSADHLDVKLYIAAKRRARVDARAEQPWVADQCLPAEPFCVPFRYDQCGRVCALRLPP